MGCRCNERKVIVQSAAAMEQARQDALNEQAAMDRRVAEERALMSGKTLD